MKNKLKIRSSSLPTFSDCMGRGLATLLYSTLQDMGYNLKERPRGIAATVGTACHSGVALDLTAIKDGVQRPSLQQVQDCAVTELESVDGKITYDPLTPTRTESIRQVLEISKYHYSVYSPLSHPQAVEQRLWCTVDDNIILTGQPDSIEKSGCIRDLKTGAKKNYIIQIGAYSLLAQSNNIKITSGEIIGIPRPARNKPVVGYVEKINGDVLQFGAVNLVLNLLKLIKKNVDAVKKGEPIYCVNPSSMLCNPKYCNAYGTKFCVATYKSPI